MNKSKGIHRQFHLFTCASGYLCLEVLHHSLGRDCCKQSCESEQSSLRLWLTPNPWKTLFVCWCHHVAVLCHEVQRWCQKTLTTAQSELTKAHFLKRCQRIHLRVLWPPYWSQAQALLQPASLSETATSDLNTRFLVLPTVKHYLYKTGPLFWETTCS